jgi:glycosyltransferase involved in cell wall biosynthesis
MTDFPLGGPPFFSVLIPSYNRPEYLATAVGSVLASTFPSFELVVSDDSSPRAMEIADVMKRHSLDPRVRFVSQNVNLREPANRAFLSSTANGEWQLFLADDDLLHPGALESLVHAIESNPGVQLFTFGYTIIDEEGRPQYSRRAPNSFKIHRNSPFILKEFFACDAFPYWFYQPATWCCHPGVNSRIKPNSDIGIGDDLMFLFDYIDDGGTILVVPEVLMSYRRVEACDKYGQPNQSMARLANSSTRYSIFQDLQRRNDLCPEVAEVVESQEFRRRFVYDSLAAEAAVLEAVARELGMSEVHQKELLGYYNNAHPYLIRVRGYFVRARVFLTLFGWSGAVEILKVTFQRAISSLRGRLPRAG